MSNLNNKVLFTFLFTAAFIQRVVYDFGPNVELVTTSLVLSNFYLGKKPSMWLVFLIMLLTDLVLGNTNIFLFTWTGFLIPATSIANLRSKKHSFFAIIQSGIFWGLGTNLFFYFWTNFGVWLLDSWGMYTNDLTGLLSSYINALPFFKNQIVSTLLFIPLGFFTVESMRYTFSMFSKIFKNHTIQPLSQQP